MTSTSGVRCPSCSALMPDLVATYAVSSFTIPTESILTSRGLKKASLQDPWAYSLCPDASTSSAKEAEAAAAAAGNAAGTAAPEVGATESVASGGEAAAGGDATVGGGGEGEL
mmetsp:Transcript_61247/g.164757  ORF Transcript_61247/g.164757 Transcript_61247/m.164757 type:complete len:113 (+) Transcript_61247:1339-1677(+)